MLLNNTTMLKKMSSNVISGKSIPDEMLSNWRKGTHYILMSYWFILHHPLISRKCSRKSRFKKSRTNQAFHENQEYQENQQGLEEFLLKRFLDYHDFLVCVVECP